MALSPRPHDYHQRPYQYKCLLPWRIPVRACYLRAHRHQAPLSPQAHHRLARVLPLWRGQLDGVQQHGPMWRPDVRAATPARARPTALATASAMLVRGALPPSFAGTQVRRHALIAVAAPSGHPRRHRHHPRRCRLRQPRRLRHHKRHQTSPNHLCQRRRPPRRRRRRHHRRHRRRPHRRHRRRPHLHLRRKPRLAHQCSILHPRHHQQGLLVVDARLRST